MTGLLSYVWERRAEIAGLTGEHVLLVFAATFLAVGIGVPLGVALTRRPRLAGLALGAASVVQTVPSLALLGLLIPLPLFGGIGKSTAIIALVVYALLPILRNTHAGIRSVDPAVLEAADEGVVGNHGYGTGVLVDVTHVGHVDVDVGGAETAMPSIL